MDLQPSLDIRWSDLAISGAAKTCVFFELVALICWLCIHEDLASHEEGVAHNKLSVYLTDAEKIQNSSE
eukprot:4527325-Amphidinium_carterae.1